jgi:hypothetical protein
MWHVFIPQLAAFGPAVTSALCVLGDFQRSNFGATGLSDLQPNAVLIAIQRQRNIVTMLRGKLSLSRHKSIDSVSRLLLRSSLHNVARLAGHESFDIVDQLIRQNLHSFLAGPSDVRSYNEVRQIQIQEHVASRGRLIGENV